MNTRERAIRVRTKISYRSDRMRLIVFRSNKAIYAQVIGVAGKVMAEAHGKDAKIVGSDVAKKALANKVTAVVFDRSGYRYHGRIRALAEAAREAGLKF
jgi:large subunit ribosomal protein L18